MRGCEIFRQGRPFDHTVAERLSLRGLEWIQHPVRPTLHFLHGIAFCSRLYWPYLRNLTAAGYNLCMHDLEGHGESDLEGEFSGWRLAADRAASVISARRLRQRGGPLIGTGHSYGASLSLILAAEQPDLFDALVLLDPMLMPEQILQQARDGLHQFPLDKTLARRNHWEDAGAAAAYLRSKAAFKDWSDDALDGFIEYNLVPGEEAGLVLRCDPRTEAQVLADPHSSTASVIFALCSGASCMKLWPPSVSTARMCGLSSVARRQLAGIGERSSLPWIRTVGTLTSRR